METKSVQEIKKGLQEDQYHFPYHWLPTLTSEGCFSTGRTLWWGMEYLTYMDAVAKYVARLRPGSVIDIGCGDGRFRDFLPASVARYMGVDLSSKAIALARILNRGGTFMDSALADVEGRFELAVLVEVMEHIPEVDMGDFMGELAGCLVRGGAVLVSVPTKNRPVARKHFRHYDLPTLKQHFARAGLEMVDFQYVHKIGRLSSLLGNLATNRFFTLNPSLITRAIWRLHCKFTYSAKSGNGAHLIALARKKED